MTEILREIGMIARALDSISNIEFKEYDLTKGQYLYLVRIYENPGLNQEELSYILIRLNNPEGKVIKAIVDIGSKGNIIL